VLASVIAVRVTGVAAFPVVKGVRIAYLLSVT
jgi:hypothetical protein